MALHGTPALIPGSTETTANTKGEYHSTREYWVYADPTDSDIVVLRALPSGLQRYTSDPAYAGFVVIEVRVKDDGQMTYPGDGKTLVRRWIVSPTYDVWTNLLNSPDGNPINKPPVASIEATESQVPSIVDNSGNPILNSVGDPYDPPLEQQQTVVAIVIRQNMQKPNIVSMLTNWADHVNATQWGQFPPRTLLFAPINLPEPEYYQDGGFVFYPMEFRLNFNPNTWDKQVVNQGYRCYDTSQASTGQDANGNNTYPLKNILIENEPAQEPVLLSYPSGEPLFAPITKSDIQINVHQVYGTVELNNLPFANVVIPTGS